MPIKPSKRKTKRSTNPARHSKNRLQALPSIKNEQLLVVGVLLIVALGAWMISRAFATTYVATPQTEQAKCKNLVQNYTYQVPFGSAPWNIPVCNLPKHPQSADYANRFYNYAYGNDGTAASAGNRGRLDVSFGFEPAASNFTRAVYFAKDATTTIQVRVCGNGCSPSNFDDGATPSSANSYLPNRSIPWNPTWKAAEGGDNEMVILDDTNGQLISLAGVRTGLGAFTLCGIIAPERLCVTNAKILRDQQNNVTDYRTYAGSSGDRGGGISYYATLLTPQEVAAGEIRHALGIGIVNTAFGPECTKSQLATNDPKVVGVTCGTAVAPAAKFEWASARKLSDRVSKLAPIDNYVTLDKTIPEGMRFALNITETDITNWINSRADLKANPTKAQTARIIARALRDYGMMPLDTSGTPARVQVAGVLSEKNKALWNQLGITQDSDDNILKGLLTPSNIYVVDTPTNNCTNGTKSKYYCPYTSSLYQINSPSPATTTSSTSIQPTTTVTPTVVTSSPPPTSTPPPSADTQAPTAPLAPTPSLSLDLLRFRYNIVLNWKASTDNIGVKAYRISRNGQQIGQVNNLTFTDTTAVANTPYTYTIQAIDAAGNVSSPATLKVQGSCFLLWCSLN